MIVINLDRRSRTPIFRQIQEKIADLIDGGALPAGERLPASRELADYLGVNRTTVCRAYEELTASGHLVSTPGSYTKVRKKTYHPVNQSRRDESVFPWEKHIGGESRLLLEAQDLHRTPPVPKGCIDLLTLAPDTALNSEEEIRRCLFRALQNSGEALLQYGDPAGYYPLRQAVTRQMKLHGIDLTPENILITNGAQEGIALLIDLLVEENSPVAVEEPTYSLVLPLLKRRGARIIGIPMGTEGMDLDRLEKVLQTERPRMVYTMPSFQNPTGITTGIAHRERLLALCESRQIPLVEDAFVEEMKYFGAPVVPVKALDSRGGVIYVGTFSKVLYPGLRVGWVAGSEEVIEKLKSAKQAAGISGVMLTQGILAEFIDGGRLEGQLKRAHRLYRKRMTQMLKLCREELSLPGITHTRPHGGYTLWVEIPRCRLGEQELMDRFAEAGVAAAPGSCFYAAPPREGVRFRLSVARAGTEEISRGLHIIGGILREEVER